MTLVVSRYESENICGVAFACIFREFKNYTFILFIIFIIFVCESVFLFFKTFNNLGKFLLFSSSVINDG